MNRQAEMEFLEKQKLILEVSTLKAENALLKDQLQVTNTPLPLIALVEKHSTSLTTEGYPSNRR
jgi:hypothetical protein